MISDSRPSTRADLDPYRRHWFRATWAGIVLIVATATPLLGAEPPIESEGIARLWRAAGADSTISLDRATGTVSFLRTKANSQMLKATPGATLHEATIYFLNEHRRAFGLADPSEELQVLGEKTDRFGFRHINYTQVFRGVPVFASDLQSHFDADGALIAVSASTVPIRDLDPLPNIAPARAAAIAVAAVEALVDRRGNETTLESLSPQLIVYRTGLFQGIAGRNHLAYRIEVVGDLRSVREFIFVDAHNGKVLERITGIQGGLDRKIYAGGLEPQYLEWSEGNPLPYSGDDAEGINDLIDYAEDAYNFFLTLSGGAHPSYDAADAAMLSVFDDPGLFCFVGPNAYWNGTNTGYCSGTTADDVVAHEWAHAYTEYNHGLVYLWQSGALNESFSDIFGEAIDHLNGAGADSPGPMRAGDGSQCSSYDPVSPGDDDSLRWLMGEDAYAFGGAIRDMWRPECQNDPGRVGSTSYWCASDDGGGVHTNSGVPNHAFALLVDGGTFNGQTVAGIGLTRAAQIYWYAMTTYQGPATDFADHADALEASCAALIGADLPEPSTDTATAASSGLTITAAHCSELNKAITATELRSEPAQCDFEPILDNDPPPLCAGLGSKQTISLTDWESGLGDWTASTPVVLNPATFDTPDWAAVGDLPDGRTGLAAFVENILLGDCETDIEAGVLTLESPAIEIPPGSLVPRLAVEHWLATEALQDGGNLKISVNGGPFIQVPASAFDVSPYNDVLAVIE